MIDDYVVTDNRDGFFSKINIKDDMPDILPPIITNYKISFLFCTDFLEMNILLVKIINSCCKKEDFFHFKSKKQSSCLVVGSIDHNVFSSAELHQSIRGKSIKYLDNLMFFNNVTLCDISTNNNKCCHEIKKYTKKSLIIFSFDRSIHSYSTDTQEDFVYNILDIKKNTGSNILVVSPISEYYEWDLTCGYLQQISRPLLVADNGVINCIYSPGNYPYIDPINYMEVN